MLSPLFRKRLTTTTYPDSNTTVNAYDGPGNLGGWPKSDQPKLSGCPMSRV